MPPNGRRKVQAVSRFAGHDSATDYDVACDVKGYLGVVAAGKGHAVVLGEEPFPSTWFEVENRLFLVRWVSADSEEDALSAVVLALAEPQTSICDVQFMHPGGDLFLMDASDDAEDAIGEQLIVELPKGTYSVSTVGYVDGQIEVIFHEISLV